MKEKIIENCKTLFYALIIALFIRSFFFQPFYIPSSSMEPNLLIGDRLFVSKYSYGYSRHSLPFSPKIYNKRIFKKMPERGDVIVFKTPADNRTDYIKRLIGLPGDKIQFINGDLFLNDNQILKTANHFVIINGEIPEKALMAMKSTQLKVSRGWNSIIKDEFETDPQTKKSIPAPSFSRIYKLNSVENSGSFTWHGYKVSLLRKVDNASIYQMAKEFHNSLKKSSAAANTKE